MDIVGPGIFWRATTPVRKGAFESSHPNTAPEHRHCGETFVHLFLATSEQTDHGSRLPSAILQLRPLIERRELRFPASLKRTISPLSVPGW